eukprot:gene16660-22775_t
MVAWTEVAIPTTYYQSFAYVAVSGTGQYMAFTNNEYSDIYTCGVFVSNDYGSTWNNTINSDNIGYGSYCSAVEISDNGNFIISACTNPNDFYSTYIASSINYGSNWTLNYINSLQGAPNSMALNSTGQQVAYCSFSGVYISKDYGSSFPISPGLVIECQSITSCSSGQYIAALVEFGDVYLSNDYGSTWSISTGISTSTALLACISMSASGQFITAVGYGTDYNPAYVSSNYGASFTYSPVPFPPFSLSTVAMDDSGQMAFAEGALGLYTSNNYGKTFSISLSDKDGICATFTSILANLIATNSDGSIVLVNWCGNLYIGQSSQPTKSPSSSPSIDLSAGAVAGIVIAVVAVVGVITGGVLYSWWFLLKKKNPLLEAAAAV